VVTPGESGGNSTFSLFCCCPSLVRYEIESKKQVKNEWGRLRGQFLSLQKNYLTFIKLVIAKKPKAQKTKIE